MSNFGKKFSGSGIKSRASTRVLSKGTGYPPVLAYWIFGSNGDKKRILKAIYHPRNQYLLQLDAGASEVERAELALSVESESVFKAFGNVDVVGESYPLDKIGASALSAVLHAAALLLKIGSDWDWFILLSASDHPLISQDDLLHAFTFLPRDLNFIDYSTNTGWKERLKINQIVIDPNLYYRENTQLMYAVETRRTPDDFKIFGGFSLDDSYKTLHGALCPWMGQFLKKIADVLDKCSISSRIILPQSHMQLSGVPKHHSKQ